MFFIGLKIITFYIILHPCEIVNIIFRYQII